VGQRAWLGVTLQPVDRNLAEYLGLSGPSGVMVTSVWAGSPAAEAGLATEDVVVRFDGQPVTVPTEDALAPFIETVQRAGVGSAVQLVVVRQGRRKEISVTLAAAPTTAVRAEEYRNEEFGLVAQDLTLDVIMGRGWPPEVVGALISEVETAGWAQVSGLQAGDLVLAVGESPVRGVGDLRAALEAAAAAEIAEVVFFVQRDPDTLFVPVRTSW
jgi:serine protease Do